MRFLCAEILPALRARGYAEDVTVAGTAMPDQIRRMVESAGGVAPGFLPSVEAELALRRLSLAPLRFGAGLKGKVGESWACGVPVVGTSVAAEGFSDAERAMLVADTAEGLAAAVIRLTEDDQLWSRLSAGGIQLISQTLGPEACREAVRTVVDRLLARDLAA